MATYAEYISAAMRQANYEQREDGKWFASIPGLDGLGATGLSLEETRAHLLTALYQWLPAHAGVGKNRLPDMDGISFYDLSKSV